MAVNAPLALDRLTTVYLNCYKPGQDDRDRFQQHLANIMSASFGEAAATNVRPRLERVNGGDVCRVPGRSVRLPRGCNGRARQERPVHQQAQFFVRVANGTKALDADEKQKYLAQRGQTVFGNRAMLT
jgi:hypothetical protein